MGSELIKKGIHNQIHKGGRGNTGEKKKRGSAKGTHYSAPKEGGGGESA